MTIKTKIKIQLIISIIFAGIAVFTSFNSFQMLKISFEKDKNSGLIIKGVFELNVLTNELLHNHMDRTVQQWNTRYDSLSGLIKKIKPIFKEDQIYFEKIQENLSKIQMIILKMGKKNPAQKDIVDLHAHDSKLLLYQTKITSLSHNIIFSSQQLKDKSQRQLKASHKNINLVFLILILAFLILVISQALVFYTRILKPVTSLFKVARAVALGNFDYKISEKTQDEFGDLSRAFNRMSLELKKITVSRDDLEKEVQERKRAETALENAHDELKAFVYSVSHDLRAPLRSIGGFSQIIQRRHKKSLNEEGRHYFENIIKASRQMENLIDDLLKFSRLGRKAIKIEPVSLGKVIDTALETLSDQIKKTSAQINFPKERPVIQGDLTLVTHVFINLIENALKYHKPDKRPIIDLSFEIKDQIVIVSVADNGIGIEPEYHKKIFNIFQRLHRLADYPGTGIGLAAAKKAVQLMDGQILVESELGRGSVFKIKVPGVMTAY